MSSSLSSTDASPESVVDHGQTESALRGAFVLPSMALGSLCGNICRIVQAAPWAEAYLPPGITPYTLTRYREEHPQHWESASFKSFVKEVPVASALVPEGSEFLEQLRALLVVVAFKPVHDPKKPRLMKEQLRLAQLIRSFASAGRNSHRAFYEELRLNVESPATARELVEQVSEALKVLASPSGEKDSAGSADLKAVFGKLLSLLNLPDKHFPVSTSTSSGTSGPTSPGGKTSWRLRDASIKKTRRPRGKGAIRSLTIPTDQDHAEAGRADLMMASAVGAPEQLLPLVRAIRKEFLRRTWSSNQGLVRDHIESLSDHEATWLASQALADVQNGLAQDDAVATATAMKVLLLLALGYSEDRIATISLGSSPPATPRGQPVWDGARLWVPVLRPEAAFKPNSEQVTKLEQTQNYFHLDLPPALAASLTQVLDRYGLNALRCVVKLTEYMANKRKSGPYGALTVSRTRLTARALIQKASGDLPITMLACADDFGQSRAPLYYTATPAADVAKAYRDAIWPVFESAIEASMPADEGYLIGSKLLVTDATAQALIASLIAPLRNPIPWRKTTSVAATRHNHLVNYCLGLMLASVGHRPGEALLGLRRNNFSLSAGVAFISDKQVDPTHWVRPAVLPDKVRLQIEAYLQHLSTFATHDCPVSATARVQAEAALHSSSPLFFHLDETGNPASLDWAKLKASMPAQWSLLPLNWGRTYLARKLRMAGALGDDVLTFLGHLESALYPFSAESPLALAQLAMRLQPHLNQAVAAQGIKVEKGFATGHQRAYSRKQAPAPLRRWDEQFREVELIARERQLAMRNELRASGKAIRAEAMASLASVLSSVMNRDFPVLPLRTSSERALAIETYSAAGLRGIEITQAQVSATLEGIEGASDQPALPMAARNALYQLVKFGIRELGWKATTPPPWLPVYRFEPSPFIPSMGLAIDQVMTVRAVFDTAALAHNPPESPEEALARCAIALAIYSLIDSPEEILHCLASPGMLKGLPEMPAHHFIEVECAPRYIHVDGIAALALQALQRWFNDEQAPTQEQVDRAIRANLPAELFDRSSGSALVALCQTVRVFKLYDMSGLGRSIESETTGSTHLLFERYRSIVDGVPRTRPTLPTTPKNTLRKNLPPTRTGATSSPHPPLKKFGELRKLLYQGSSGSDGKTFSTTGEALSQRETSKFREPMIRAISAYLAEGTIPGSCDALARYALHLLREGTYSKKKLAHRTIYEYITRIGAAFVSKMGLQHMSDIDPDDLTEIYEEILEEEGRHRRVENVAYTLMEFHRFARKELGAPAVSLVNQGFSDSSIGVHANIVSFSEQGNVIGMIRERIGDMSNWSTRDAAELRSEIQALVFFILLKDSYARRNEIAFLRFKDISFSDGEANILIRPNAYRGLKTVNARRRIVIKFEPDAWEWNFVKDWLDAEQARLGSKFDPNLAVFLKLATPAVHVGLPTLIAHSMKWLSSSSGESPTLHSLRHHGGTVVVSRSQLDLEDAKALSAGLGGRSLLVPEESGPREAAAARLKMGHSRLTTTGKHYHHLPISAKSRSMRRAVAAATRYQVTALSMCSLSTIDRALRAGAKTNLDVVQSMLRKGMQPKAIAPSLPGLKPEQAQTPPISDPLQLSASTVYAVLNQLAKGVDPARTGLSHGVAPQIMEGIISIAAERLSHRLPEAGSGHASKRVRALKSAIFLKQLFAIADEVPALPNRDLLEHISSEISNLNNRPSPRLRLYRSSEAPMSRLLKALDLVSTTHGKSGQHPQLLFSVRAGSGSSDTASPQTQIFQWALLACHIAFTMKKTWR